MILVCNVAFLIACVLSGAIKKWQSYYKTILYLSLCNLLYNFLCRDYLIWKFHPDFLLNHNNADLINSFVLLPSIVILYLHFLPPFHKLRTKTIYYLCWVAGFSILESIWYFHGCITYDHGWNLFCSVIFYFAMFFALELHHRSTSKALLFSVAAITFLIYAFKVPIWK